MADNIRIVGNIFNTTTVSRYSEEDAKLISSRILKEDFGGTGDYIEYYTYDIANNLLNTNYNYLSYKLPTDTGLTPGVSTLPNTAGRIQTTNVGIDSTLATPTSSLYPIIEIDPVKDLQDLGYSSGEFRVKYNFFQNKVSDFINQGLFIKEISQDRTEVRLASTTLTNDQIESGSLELINEINAADYYVDYLLNFGNNEQYIAVNVALNKAPEGYEILFKLYQPLPLKVQEKMTLWIVEEKVIPYVFDINLDKLITPPPPPTLRSPNFDIEIPNQGTVSTGYNTYSNLIGSLQSLQNSSYHQILNLLATQSVDINIDYSNFDNFVFFGSAYQRVTNFYTKVKQIEDYNNLINTYTPLTSSKPSLITEINQYSSSITNIVSQFDGFEYYLYFESSSILTSSLEYSITPYPKSGSLKPFTLLSTGSVSASVWFNWATGSAQDYDLNNYDNLEFAIPNFVKDDTTNQPFLLFLNMVGHYFDNIWVYLKSITDINLANNNLEVGISKDLVYERLKSLGLHLYNSQAGENVDQFLIGANTGSSAWDNNTTITGSYLNNIPRKDLVSELYKRIYHNLPLLLKQKGTVEGLDTLMTVFGIPNRTYYTIGSSSFYTPTGSAVTASILNVKEFGGSLKSDLVKGYNNDKVRIVSNNITGSVLSPFLSLQTSPTSSNEFRENDSHYVDISFSPQSQIDTHISGAIASNNPTWLLDDYIGDPRQLYSGSYPDLDAQRKLYFQTGVPGYAPFTSSLLNYNDFVRLIEYFDNALFKMLNDFVPERTSLSTGVTINSPVLERNKAAYAKPTAATHSVYEADYNVASISSQYGTFYNALSSSNNTKAWYTGDIEGNTVNIHQYFEDDFNPYDKDWNVWNSQHSISQSINLNSFLHSDWNVLLNNVSKSVVSTKRQDIEYVWGTTGSILTPAELQDSYLTLRSYNTSRYEGSKLTSLLYNTYTSASYTGSDGRTIVTGDRSFGKTAVIDRQSYKIGWVKNIPSQSLNFPDKTCISLKYLVDSEVRLLDLSYANQNLFEVQNTFKSGTPVVVSLSDVRKPSYQVPLDGTKSIFKGGIWYDPIIFRERNESMLFTYDSPISSSFVNGTYKGRVSNWYRYFSNNNTGTGFALTSASPTKDGQAIYEATGTSNTQTVRTEPIAYTAYGSTNWKYWDGATYPNGINGLVWYPGGVFSVSQPRIYTLIYGINLFNQIDIIDKNNDIPAFSKNNNEDYRYIFKAPNTGNYKVKGSIPVNFNRVDDKTLNNADLDGCIEFKVFAILEKANSLDTPDNGWTYLAHTNLSSINNGYPDSIEGGRFAQNASYNAVAFDFLYYGVKLKCDLPETTIQLNADEYVRFNLYIADFMDAFGAVGRGTRALDISFNQTTTLQDKAYFQIENLNNLVTEYVTSSLYIGTTPISKSAADTFIFKSELMQYSTSSATFTPKLPTSQYYTPIIDKFTIQKYDLIRLGSFTAPAVRYYEVKDVYASGSGITISNVGFFYNNINSPSLNLPLNYFEYTITSATPVNFFKVNDILTITGTSNNNKTVTVTNADYKTGDNTKASVSITNNTFTNETSNATFTISNRPFDYIVKLTSNIDTGSAYDISSFAILRPKPNETSVIIDYKKALGDVSQTILIPYDANDEIKNSVGNIYKTINPDIS